MEEPDIAGEPFLQVWQLSGSSAERVGSSEFADAILEDRVWQLSGSSAERVGSSGFQAQFRCTASCHYAGSVVDIGIGDAD